MLIDGTGPFATAKPDARLIKLLIRAHRFNATLIGSAGVPFAIPIDREPLTSPAGSFFGGFRTPALTTAVQVDDGPASETLHVSRPLNRAPSA